MSARLLMIDNFDSFTFMLVDYLLALGASVEVKRADALRAAEALAGGWDGYVISPGPGQPEEAGVSTDLAAACIAAKRPLLGVCLGHQAIALACGGRVDKAPPVHGKTGCIRHDDTGLFAGLPSPLVATRYHSLVALDAPEPLEANAWSDDGLIMGFRHQNAPAHGVQFHPESIGTADGRAMLARFLELVEA